MSSDREAIREIIKKVWEVGKARGMSEEEIISLVDETMKRREPEEVITVKVPQVLYGAPPKPKIHVINVSSNPPTNPVTVVEEDGFTQVVYGPPKPAVYDMFDDAPKGNDENTPPRHR